MEVTRDSRRRPKVVPAFLKFPLLQVAAVFYRQVVLFNITVTDSILGEITVENYEMSTLVFGVALACGIWTFFVVLVQTIGSIQL